MAFSTLNNYEKIDMLDCGDTWVVYLAWDVVAKRHVVVRRFSISAEQSEWALQALRPLIHLRHPNILHVNSVEYIDDSIVVVSEYAPGFILREYLDRHGQLTLREALTIAKQVCDALEFAHKDGVVHRGIMPSNILVCEVGYTRVFNFGLAELFGVCAKVYPYTAVDELLDDHLHRFEEDTWSLGVTLYEMLTGIVPFKTSMQSGTNTRRHDIGESSLMLASRFNPEVSDDVDRVIVKALSRKRAQRYTSTSEMREDLEKALESSGGEVRLGTMSEMAKPLLETPDGVTIRPPRIDFGKVRIGELARIKLRIHIRGCGKIAGRIVSQPGWLFVSPLVFEKRKQSFRLTADAETASDEELHCEPLVVSIDGKQFSIPIWMKVLPERRAFIEVFWWYIPLLFGTLVPVMAGFRTGEHEALVAGLLACSLLGAMAFIVSLAANLGFVEKIISASVPIAGFIGLALIRWETMLGPTKDIMMSAVGFPIGFLLIVQTVTASRWRMWVGISMLTSLCIGAGLIMSRCWKI